MARDRAGRQRVEQVVVGPVVSEAEHEVVRLLPLGEDAAHVDAFVDAECPHLDDLVPGEDLGRCARQMLVQVVQELPRAPRAVLRLRLPVVPRDGARLALDVRSGHIRGDATQEPLDRPQPGEVEVDERVPFAAGRPCEVAVLGGEVHGQPPEPLLEVPPPPSAHDVDVGSRQLRERAQERADLGSRLREVRMELELADRPVVIEHDRASPRAPEAPPQPLPQLLVDRRRSPRAPIAAGVAAEPGQESLRPAAALETLDPLRHRLQATLPLAGGELEGGREVLDDAVDVPRVHEQRAREHLRRARELGE